jgi:octaprenyl-diphosphate synthase
MLAAESRSAAPSVNLSQPPSSLAWKQIVESVQPFLKKVAGRLTAQVQEFERELADYAAYALSAQGKQLRPTLVALSAEASGKTTDAHATAAVIIEMVHLATLIHDDVIDEADLRRGRPTLTANWGDEISVLLGDCLFAQALKLATAFPTPAVCRAVASATHTVCSGEILQTQARRKIRLTRAEYFKMLSMKTAELFALSCELGGFLNDASPAHQQALRHYGIALGTAYQIYDDCLDLFGAETTAGKSLGTDLANGKLTLPVLIAIERATPEECQQIERWIGDWDCRSLPRLMELLDSYDAPGESRTIIHQHLAAAREALLVMPLTPGRAGLMGLTEYLGHQADDLGLA